MNELPRLEAYSRPDRVSLLYFIVVLILGTMIMHTIGDRGDVIHYIIFILMLFAVVMILAVRSRRQKRPILRLYEDYMERRFLWQKDYLRFNFCEISNASLVYEFPTHDVLKLEFKDGRKPVLVQLSNLSLPVEDMYKFILERVNSAI